MRGGHALWGACIRVGESCWACARLGRRVNALHTNSDLAGPSSTLIASNRLLSFPGKQADQATAEPRCPSSVGFGLDLPTMFRDFQGLLFSQAWATKCVILLQAHCDCFLGQ